MKVLELQQKPVRVQAIQWTNNEPEIRVFVGKDDNLKFKDGGTIEVWNEESKDWLQCPMFYYILKGVKGELQVLSPEILERTHEPIVE